MSGMLSMSARHTGHFLGKTILSIHPLLKLLPQQGKVTGLYRTSWQIIHNGGSPLRGRFIVMTKTEHRLCLLYHPKQKNDQMCEKKSSQIVSMALTNELKTRLKNRLTDKQIEDLGTLLSHNLFVKNYSIGTHLVMGESIDRNIEKLRLAKEWMKIFDFENPANVLNMVNLPIPTTFTNYKHKPTLKSSFIKNNLAEMKKMKYTKSNNILHELTGRIQDHIALDSESLQSSKSNPKSQKSHIKPKPGSKTSHDPNKKPKPRSQQEAHDPINKPKPRSQQEAHTRPPNRWDTWYWSLFNGTSPIRPIPQQPPKPPDNVKKLCQCISNNGGMWDRKSHTFCTNKNIIEKSLRRVKDGKVSLIPVDQTGRRIKKIYKNKLTKREREIIELLKKLQLD